MNGRVLVSGLLIALLLAAGLLLWLGASGGSAAVPGASARDAESSVDPTTRPGLRGELPYDYDGGKISQTIADRRIRDELRRRILAGWALGDGALAEAAKQGRLAPMPSDPDGGLVDPAYIQSVIRQDMFPMAKGCYEELLKRQPDAGGRVEMFFKIVGDDKLGGLVEEVELDGGAPDAIRDEKMNTCVRESLLSLAFRPPPYDGTVTIGYPIVFAPGDDSDD